MWRSRDGVRDGDGGDLNVKLHYTHTRTQTHTYKHTLLSKRSNSSYLDPLSVLVDPFSAPPSIPFQLFAIPFHSILPRLWEDEEAPRLTPDNGKQSAGGAVPPPSQLTQVPSLRKGSPDAVHIPFLVSRERERKKDEDTGELGKRKGRERRK